mgnify:CR=1 FL=1
MEKQEKSERKNLNKEKKIIMKRNTKGITLIALVVTIIVLIILAGVSINLVFGNLGIVTKAKEAKRMQEQAELNEQIALGELSNEIDKTLGTPTQKQIKTVEELKNAGTYMTEPTTLKDSNENLIKVPKGFKIAEDSGKNVTEGIVIEDNDIIEGIGNNRGNQYVWVPVGNQIKKSDGTTVDITLGRYTFASNGTPTLKQNAENYTKEVTIDSYYKEVVIYRQGVASSGLDGLNTTSRGKKKADGTYEGIKSFIDSVKSNGGYYIARYEASYGTDGKANSKVSNSFINTNETAPTTEGALWNNITQLNAATACYDIYTTATTDLINSYAWDTAIVYIQNFSGDTEYSYKKSINSILANTGNNNDEKCKINDMASNTYEWTTEYSTDASSSIADPCTDRGGYYNDSNVYTSGRYDNLATSSGEYSTFRPTLYM